MSGKKEKEKTPRPISTEGERERRGEEKGRVERGRET
jgi:hypothetical protein